ncbi:MAG: hypothetical protein QNJ64_20785 [Crocosphaera sp.]|nr:hypothetical protein [Crocosphaera sp.]
MGGVIYIGDRQAGKTHLALELANPKKKWVTVDSLTYRKIDKKGPGGTKAEQSIYKRDFNVKVGLRAGEKEILTNWLDTPGEIWQPSSNWPDQHPDLWQNFLSHIQQAAAIQLILPPYREILPDHHPNYYNSLTRQDFITRQQWINRFKRWVKFFKQNCPRIEHLLLCLNKADLFCEDLNHEAEQLAYDPYNQKKDWQEKDQYVYYRYFTPIHPQINELNYHINDLSVRCFITSVHNRNLLELPWIYLGSYLAE